MPKKMVAERWIAILACLIFVCYWAVTLLYVTPNNPIRIIFTSQLDFFEKFFYQRWSFFAPPPKANNRLYYHFIPKQSDVKEVTIEVLQPILKAKQHKAPFNESETMLDYILSGSIDQMTSVLRDRVALRRLLSEHSLNNNTNRIDSPKPNQGWQGDAASSDRSKADFRAKPDPDPEANIMDPKADLNCMKTLVNYSFFVSKVNHLSPLDYKVEIIVTQIPIPPFEYRKSLVNGTARHEEITLFKTKPFDIPQIFD